MFDTTLPGTIQYGLGSIQTDPGTLNVEYRSETEINREVSSSESDAEIDSHIESGSEELPDDKDVLTYTATRPSNFGETNADTDERPDENDE